MPELVIYPRGAPQSALTIWPSSPSFPIGLIQENQDYFLELRGLHNPNTAEIYIDNQPVEALRHPAADTARWRWSPGFHAGRIELTIQITEGLRYETFLITDPDLEKVTREDFESMVREILEDTLALFTLSSFRTGVARGIGTELPPLARLEFLRSRIKELENVLIEINQRPMKGLTSTYQQTPARLARRVRSVDLKRSFTANVDRLPIDSPLALRMKGYFPRILYSTTKQTNLDLPEHRIIKSSLRSWQIWLSQVGEMLARSNSEDEGLERNRRTWGKNCNLLARRLRNLLELPMFAGVSAMPKGIAITSAFRRLPPYRRFFELYRDLNLGIARVQGDFLQMPLAKTYQLYELWAFLRIARAAIHKYKIKEIDPSRFFELSPAQNGLAVLKSMVIFPIGQGVALAFKKEFQEYWLESNLCGSFTRKMIPDISILKTDSDSLERIIVLDAKYRVANQLNDAIASLHMYRDAILQEVKNNPLRKAVIAAYILTPYPSTVASHWKAENMPARLFHPEYRSTFKFGALTLIPGMSLDKVETALDLMLQDTGIESVSHDR